MRFSSRIDEIEARHGELAGRPGPIYVICEHGVRSRFVAGFLAALGYPDVVNVREGMCAWTGETASGS